MMKTSLFLVAMLTFTSMALADDLTVATATQGNGAWNSFAIQRIYFEDASSPSAEILRHNLPNSALVVNRKEDADVVVKTYYAATAWLANQRGGIGAMLSEQDVEQGKVPDRFHFKRMQCQAPAEYMTGSRAQPIADAMGDMNLNGANISSGTELGITLIASLFDVFSPAKKEVDCNETFTVCPLSASFCPFDEYVLTEVLGVTGDVVNKNVSWITAKTSTGNGFNEKAMLDQHLKFLSSALEMNSHN